MSNQKVTDDGKIKTSSFGSYLKKEMLDTFSCNADAINYNNHFIRHPPKKIMISLKSIKSIFLKDKEYSTYEVNGFKGI